MTAIWWVSYQAGVGRIETRDRVPVVNYEVLEWYGDPLPRRVQLLTRERLYENRDQAIGAALTYIETSREHANKVSRPPQDQAKINAAFDAKIAALLAASVSWWAVYEGRIHLLKAVKSPPLRQGEWEILSGGLIYGFRLEEGKHLYKTRKEAIEAASRWLTQQRQRLEENQQLSPAVRETALYNLATSERILREVAS